jgi:hypothetical protein
MFALVVQAATKEQEALSELRAVLSKCPALEAVLSKTPDMTSLVAKHRDAMAASSDVSRCSQRRA